MKIRPSYKRRPCSIGQWLMLLFRPRAYYWRYELAEFMAWCEQKPDDSELVTVIRASDYVRRAQAAIDLEKASRDNEALH